MISLADQSQTEQGCFYVNFDGHLASFYIHENPQKIRFISSIPSCSVSFTDCQQLCLLRLPGIWLVCYGTTLNYLNMYNGINLNYE